MKNIDQIKTNMITKRKKIMLNNISTNLPIHDNAGIMEVVSKKYLPDNRTTSDVLLQSFSVSFPVVSFNYHHKNATFY